MVTEVRPRARSVQAVLDEDPGLRPLIDRIDTLRHGQQILSSGWPHLNLRIMAVRDDSLTVGAPNAALSAKCRQLEPSMLAALRPLYPGLMSIRFRTDPAATSLAQPRPAKQPISARSLATLRAAIPTMAAGPLREALLRLVNRPERR